MGFGFKHRRDHHALLKVQYLQGFPADLKNWPGDWSGQITNCRSPYLLEMAEKKAKS